MFELPDIGDSAVLQGVRDQNNNWTYEWLPATTAISYVVGCRHCGGTHAGECRRIKRIEYHDNGTIKSVEYRE